MSGSTAVERGFADALLAADQMKVDENAGTSAREINDLRAMELTLVAHGKTRAQARAAINKIKGKRDAAPETDTPGAVDPELTGLLAGLLESLRA
jgi:ATP-dependent Clp protease protease subunit